MPESTLTRFLGLPELEFQGWKRTSKFSNMYQARKRSRIEVCPKCASPSTSVYDHRFVEIKDEPIRRSLVVLRIKKRRFFCKPCKKPFTEPIQGILPGRRTTQRYREALMRACENYTSLKRVRRDFQCSSGYVYKTFYQHLQQRLVSKINYPLPHTIGVDEHFFSRRRGRANFATVITDMKHKRIRALAYGKDRKSLKEQLCHLPGRENVKWVAMDLSETYKGAIFELFPNAQIVADKFHVLRLLTPHLIKHRKNITASRMNTKAKRLLTMSAKKLDYWDRKAIWNFLEDHPELKELYEWKERLHGLYRIKGYHRAQKAMKYMLEEMKSSKLSEIKRLRRTLLKWQNEVLNYFRKRLTNARTEGFNNVCKLVQKQAYGYKNFLNYELRVLNACC